MFVKINDHAIINLENVHEVITSKSGRPLRVVVKTDCNKDFITVDPDYEERLIRALKKFNESYGILNLT